MKKIITLTESDLSEIIQKIINENTHIVSRGETLSKIANKYGVSVNDIIKTNKITNPNNIPVGKKLIIGKDSSSTKSVEKSAVSEDIPFSKSNPHRNSFLKFDGNELHWVSGGSILKSWDAESGRTFMNTPIYKASAWRQFTKTFTDRSKLKDEGPPPPGKYIVGPMETRSKQEDAPFFSKISALWDILSGQKVADSEKSFYADTSFSKIAWGNYRLKMNPTSGTKTYGRGSFYIHGGSFEGSLGCIDLTDEMDDFARFFAVWCAVNKTGTITLVVDYGEERNGVFSKFWYSMFD